MAIAVALWSSGMIPASGAGGPGFEPRKRPFWRYGAISEAGTHTESEAAIAIP